MTSFHQQIAEYCREKLDIKNAILQPEYRYVSLPFCIIDTVYSIGVTYEATRNTVRRFCHHFGFKTYTNQWPPDISEQLSLGDFIKIQDDYGNERMTREVYENKQRTSSKNGILKSEAVFLFSCVLSSFQIEYLQDIPLIKEDGDFEDKIKSIPGQKSGISLRYFYMLTGSDDYIKPDRMIRRFIDTATNNKFASSDSNDIHDAIIGAYQLLAVEHPRLTPRVLDGLIWKYQREQVD